MELVFFYINQTPSKFIEKKGFNFSSNYNFYVEYTDGTYVLKQKKCKNQLPSNFFDEQGCITNITAIVGENGAGKTTLLTELSDCFGSVEEQEHLPEFVMYYAEKYEKEKTLAIYVEKSELVCYHNLDNFKNDTEIKECYLHQGSADKSSENISKICISNNMYALKNEAKSSDEIFLNPNSLNTLTYRFYEKKCRKETSSVGEYYYEVSNIVCWEKKVDEFQQILDVLYLQYIHEKNIENVFVKNSVETLKIKFNTAYRYLRSGYGKFSEKIKKVEPHELYNTILSIVESDLRKSDIFVNIYINLLYELLIYRNMKGFSWEKIDNKEILVNCISNMINELLNQNDSYADFFQEAFQEIQEYESVLNKCGIYLCSLPISAYISYKEVNCKSEAYGQFLDLIKKSVFERKYSYVLKYINIGGLHLASGERALLNFFSWIHMVPYFNYISNDIEESLHENVLLLIDEIDLYCHPQWQQKILNYLIEEIKAEYPDKKVQIIFTTHSPIVLSDMPRSNVIFLKRENNRCSIDEYDDHEETFGANIYKLFDDAFFLGKKGQVGEFARKKIQEIIDKIKPEIKNKEEVIYPSLTGEEIELLEQQISLIGEKVIRDKLYEMLYKCKYNSLDWREKKIKIYEEKIRQLQNGENL